MRVKHNPGREPSSSPETKLQTSTLDWKNDQPTVQIGPEMKRIRVFKENTLPMPMAAYGVEAKT